ncbi:MAG: acyltransferase family protein [Clostridium sp.]
MIKSLQGLRVIGMIFIFFFHLSFMKEGNLAVVYNIFFYEGYFAVTFFFILSGLVTYKSLNKKNLSSNLKESINNTKRKLKKYIHYT